MRFDNLRLKKDQLSQDCINAKKMGDVRQDREKRSAELLNLERQTTQRCAETLQKYEKTCNTFEKNEKLYLKKIASQRKKIKSLIKTVNRLTKKR